MGVRVEENERRERFRRRRRNGRRREGNGRYRMEEGKGGREENGEMKRERVKVNWLEDKKAPSLPACSLTCFLPFCLPAYMPA